MESTLPLLLLDVDGPLNPFTAKPSRRPKGYTTHRLNPLTGDRVTRWATLHGTPLRVWLNPGHGAPLLKLPYDLVWATTWQHEANLMIGPVIGLPELPVITWPEETTDTLNLDIRQGTYWKTRHIVDCANLPTFDPTGLAVNWDDTSRRRS